MCLLYKHNLQSMEDAANRVCLVLRKCFSFKIRKDVFLFVGGIKLNLTKGIWMIYYTLGLFRISTNDSFVELEFYC